jgi:hypothetical protein
MQMVVGNRARRRIENCQLWPGRQIHAQPAWQSRPRASRGFSGQGRGVQGNVGIRRARKPAQRRGSVAKPLDANQWRATGANWRRSAAISC